MRGYPAVVTPRRRDPASIAHRALKLCLLPAARWWRRRLDRRVTFVGITGSTGKTTAKRLLGEILEAQGPTRVSTRSGNGPKKVARSILTTWPRHRFCVQELGAFGPGSMDEILWPLEPDVALITNAGWDHLSAFGGPEAVALEKGKLVECLPPGGLAVLNADDPRIRALAGRGENLRVVLYGTSEDADIGAERVGVDGSGHLRFTLRIGEVTLPVTTQLTGAHWLGAALGVLATAISMGVDPATAVAGLGRAGPEPHRLSRLQTESGITFLQDDWKAPAWTVEPALQALGAVPAERRVAIIGRLSDDRRKPRRLYTQMARLARDHADLVVLVGPSAHHGLRARSATTDEAIVAFPNAAEAQEFLEENLRAGDAVLIKANGGDHLERLALAAHTTVRCWIDDCDRTTTCERCRLRTRSRPLRAESRSPTP